MTRAAAALIAAFTGLALMAAPASAVDLTAMTAADRDAFRAEVRAYLLENPEIIVEAINLLEERKAEAQANADLALVQLHADALFDDGYSWTGGNPDGDITLVEFMDYRCGYCRRAVPEVDSLLKSDGNIRIIIKEFPILGEDSMVSSRFAVATKQVAGDAAYKMVHDALLEFNGEMTDAAVRRIGDGLGLDSDAILAAMDSEAVTQVIFKNRQLAQALQITGTPTFVLHDEMLRGYLPAEQMARIIAQKRG